MNFFYDFYIEIVAAFAGIVVIIFLIFIRSYYKGKIREIWEMFEIRQQLDHLSRQLDKLENRIESLEGKYTKDKNSDIPLPKP